MENRTYAGRWISWGFFAMFVLIGVAAVLAVLTRGTPSGSAAMFPFGFSWVWGIFGFFFFLWIFSWFFRPWGWGRWWRWGGPYGYYRPWGHEDAIEILRARYARGELTKEQFDSMMQDLRRQP